MRTRTAPSDDWSQPFRHLVARIDPDAELIRAWRLTGGVSAEVTALEIARPGGRTERLVVRRHGPIDLAQNPRAARDEFTLMRIARSRGLAVPAPVFLDESCDLFPTPVVVVEFCDGTTDFAPVDLTAYVEQSAAHLARIHAIPDTAELSFLPRQDKGFGARPARLDESMGEGRIREALEATWPLPPGNAAVLLHGDYWPGNLLWRDGALVAVIDWEDARVGDPLADLGNSRLEFLWALGPDAMTAFTDAYRARTSLDLADLPYWDLCAALRPCGRLSGWGLDAAVEARMRHHHAAFVAQALADLR